jgi:hypothetical protein
VVLYLLPNRMPLTSDESLELLVSPSLSFEGLSLSNFLGVVDVFLTSEMKNLLVNRLFELIFLPAESGLDGTFISLVCRIFELALALINELLSYLPAALVYFLILFAE